MEKLCEPLFLLRVKEDISQELLEVINIGKGDVMVVLHGLNNEGGYVTTAQLAKEIFDETPDNFEACSIYF